jgi:predicted nucleic acid-binding protein
LRVYAESNFVLELVLEQEELAACETIVEHARHARIVLAVPAFALAEPFTTLVRRKRERHRLNEDVRGQLVQIGRSKSRSVDPKIVEDMVSEALVRSMQRAEERFREVRTMLVEVATVLPLEAATFARADDVAHDFGLELPDALVLASVLLDPEFGATPSCFLNRNTKDFEDPSIVELLKAGSCQLLGHFHDGLAYLEPRITGP